MRRFPAPAVALALLTIPAALTAQGAPEPASGPRLAPAPFSSMTWRTIGPTSFSGRITDIDVARRTGQPDVIFVGSGSGGVFRSNNKGTTWEPVFDRINGAMSIGDVTVAPSAPDIVWVGTGEGTNPARDWGDGIYKSTDGGTTWTNMGLKDTRHIGRIVIHPSNPDIVYVASAGHMWGPHPERGLFKTTDGGRTWAKILYVDPNTGVNDIVMDHANPQVLYASTYQRQRNNYGGILNGPGSGIHKSTDGGATWTKLTRGLPTTDKGRIGLEMFPGDSRIIYADVEVSLVASVGGGGQTLDCAPPDATRTAGPQGRDTRAGEGGVYRSIDGGETWEHLNATAESPAGYFSEIWADPKDRNRLYRAGVNFHISDDMGKTFRVARTGLHVDYHALWIDPQDPNHIIVGSDGGIAITWDRTATWLYRDNLPIVQFYEISVDNRDPYLVCGGTQDNGSWCTPSAVRDRNGISGAHAYSVGGGDGFHVHVDPRDSTYMISESQNGNLQRVSLASMQRQSIRPSMAPRPRSCFDVAAGQPAPARPHRYRWEWNTPITFSSVTPGVVYTGADVLFRSTDRGGSWTPVSRDLTAQIDRDTIFVMGKALGAVNYSPNGSRVSDPTLTSIFGSVLSISESAVDPRVLYVGTTDGQVQVTRDLGATWKNVSSRISGVPRFTYISTVLASRTVAGRVYVTFDGRGNADDKPYVFVSDNFGDTWRQITSGLPDAPITRIAEHPSSPHLIAVGHARGVHFSNDAGATWHSLNTNMPTVPVGGLVFQARDNALVVGTYGRGIWILDDVGPLQSLTARALAQDDAVLASTTRGRQMNLFSSGATYGDDELYFSNPEFAAGVSYHLRQAASGFATITIRDAQGARVRQLQGTVNAGLNRVTWDMRMDLPLAAEGGPTLAGRPAGGGGGGRGGAATAAGPLVLPGRYSVTIAIPGVARELRGNISVEADPSDGFTMTQRRTRQAAIMSLYNLQRTLGAVREAAATLPDSVVRRTRIADEVQRLLPAAAATMRSLESFNAVPTADQRRQMTWIFEDARRATNTVNALTRGRAPIALPTLPATPAP
ncbi:MAG TPA: hypothetical protein VEB19_07230 [Gemmatimonadaceae bacterium]|nr:hypothetical protein [Gemmatimonadaceae bacterium]